MLSDAAADPEKEAAAAGAAVESIEPLTTTDVAADNPAGPAPLTDDLHELPWTKEGWKAAARMIGINQV
jgi:hypothetical protein